jgi:CHAD domain-containing protein
MHMAKAWKILNFNPDDNVKICLKKITRARFREMFSYEKGTIEGKDIESLHNMRVSSRRLQAVLKIFQDCFPQKKFKPQYKKIRNIIRILGHVRNYDVFIDTLEKYSALLYKDFDKRNAEHRHKQTITNTDKKSIDLLIAHQKTLRLQERRTLLKELKALENENFKQKFMEFINKSL